MEMKRNPTEIQEETSKYKSNTKLKIIEMQLELEKLRHKNIMEELETMIMGRISSFNRTGSEIEK